MTSLLLRKNQVTAINESINNDFISGIHYHATGSGKSLIAMNILIEFNKKYPNKNILWICERKDILNQQFSKNNISKNGYKHIISKFNFLNFVNNKNDKWYDSLNSSIFWKKPYLCIINRCFLTSKEKYKHIKNPIHLVIHDECHSIENNSTQKFYQWLTKVNNKKSIIPRIIGFSATPEKIEPLKQILTKYSIYDGFKDKVILPPKIVWLKSEKNPPLLHLLTLIKLQIEELPYKKIIVWCGMIEECIRISLLWTNYFTNFKINLDFNNLETKIKELEEKDYFKNKEEIKTIKNFGTYNDFYHSKNNSIMFCAVKHREGSDIPNIDTCIFMDLVEKRSERLFIQCIGRVLRKDELKLKKYGLIIDLKARSTIEICNRVQHYLKLKNIFPWKYSIQNININKIPYFMNSLLMVKDKSNKIKLNNDLEDKTFSRDDICKYFIRTLPKGDAYKKRLDYELELIISKNLFKNMIRALDILKLTKNIPHVTRGSCGSSLVCYLLGISHVDPVKYNISFARFLNKYRNNLPDIDFDFPHYLRDEVFLKLFQKWGNKIARISNHNYYHEKSALREALRRNGIRRFISKLELNKEIRKLPTETKLKIMKTTKELIGKFKGYSLHCGGIIYYPDGIPKKKRIFGSGKSIIQQVNLNKINVSENKNFKIDILSSCGLSQLYYCHSFENIDFNSHIGDPKTIELLSRGDNIGLTLAESPLMRKALLLIKPKTIMDLAICLSIIRPAAKNARKEFEIGKYFRKSLIFDDDAIHLISKLLNCDEELADKIRRKGSKGKKGCIDVLKTDIKNKPFKIKIIIRNLLISLRKYGFCKAHALSYAQLVWQLAYQKAHHPQKFWEGTLKNTRSSYKKWVHLYEAKCHQVDLPNKEKNKSVYSIYKDKKTKNKGNQLEQIRKFGYWNIDNDKFFGGCYCYKSINNKDTIYNFKGLIAASRVLSYGKNKRVVLFIGVAKQTYIEIILSGNFYYDSKKILIKGKGKLINKLYETIECSSENINIY